MFCPNLLCSGKEMDDENGWFDYPAANKQPFFKGATSAMADADTMQASADDSSTTASGALLRSIYLPYLLLALIHIPLVFVYVLRDLASELRPHYHFYPFLAAAVVFLLWERWPRSAPRFRKSDFSLVLFVLSCLSLLLALLFLEPAIASVSFCLGLSSFLLLVRDNKSGGSLFAISLLPYILCHSPFGEDRFLITQLQVRSSRITSVLLDMFGIYHDMPGTVLQTAGKQWGVEEACSGVQSFFTLLFCSLFWAIWMRRPLFRGALLVASSLFWAIVMNTIRIFLIPFMYVHFAMDLSTGYQHALLGYATLVIGILLTLSTDQLLAFAFGEIDVETSSPVSTMDETSFWNRYIAGMGLEFSEKWAPNLASFATRWSLVGLSLLAVLFSSGGLINAFTADGVDFFRSSVVLRAENDWLPDEIDGWKKVDYTEDTRARHSDLGQRSNLWTYSKAGQSVTFSFDQAFPGWHELTHCYQISPIGWLIDREAGGRQRLSVELPAEGAPDELPEEASLVAVDLIEPNAGLHGYLLFGLDDIDGNAIEAPGDWSFVTAFIERLKNRISYEVRKSVVRGEAYQTQLFCQRKPDEAQREEYLNLYAALRVRVQSKIAELSAEGSNFMSQSELDDARRIQEREEKEREDSERLAAPEIEGLIEDSEELNPVLDGVPAELELDGQ